MQPVTNQLLNFIMASILLFLSAIAATWGYDPFPEKVDRIVAPDSEAEAELDRKLEHEKQYKCMVTNLWFEARGQPLIGMYAVAWVVKNRMENKNFPKTICSVVTSRSSSACAFSWYCDGKSDQPVLRNKMDRVAMQKIMKVAKEFSTGTVTLPDITEGALYFHAIQVDPSWSAVYNQTVVINNHRYYR
jgi:N-acetylmuramoyl-L-alanine amidase